MLYERLCIWRRRRASERKRVGYGDQHPTELSVYIRDTVGVRRISFQGVPGLCEPSHDLHIDAFQRLVQGNQSE
jgi:hypothetical protein